MDSDVEIHPARVRADAGDACRPAGAGKACVGWALVGAFRLGGRAGPDRGRASDLPCSVGNSFSGPDSRRLTSMSGSDKRKQSLYFPEEMLKEIGAEATRQDRSLSWIVQKAWKAARKDLVSIPSVADLPGTDDKGGAAK